MDRSDDRASAGDGRRRERRPEGASDELVRGAGTASEAHEYLVRARGHLYSFHQLVGRADLLFGDAADQLERAGATDEAQRLRTDVVGRNVLDGRWTFQIVEEFDDLYYGPVDTAVQALEANLMEGRRHVLESELKDRRRTVGRPGHERRPPTAHSADVDAAED